MIDDDENTSPHTESSRYLAEKGVSAALEFRDLPLHLVERTWHDVMGRDSSATPGAVVIALRSIAAARAAAPPPAEPDEEEPPPAPATAARAVGATDQRMAQLWQSAMQAMQARQPAPDLAALLQDTALLTLDGGVATILASTPIQKQHLENRYLAPIRRALGELLGSPVQARVVADPADLP